MLQSLIEQESKALMMLNHPNIVYARDIIHSNNNIYIVMNLCKNGDLRQKLTRNHGKMEEWEAMKILY